MISVRRVVIVVLLSVLATVASLVITRSTITVDNMPCPVNPDAGMCVPPPSATDVGHGWPFAIYYIDTCDGLCPASVDDRGIRWPAAIEDLVVWLAVIAGGSMIVHLIRKKGKRL